MTSNRLNRFCRAFVLLVALPGLSANASAELSFVPTNSAPAAIPRRASIIFIQVDGLGYGDLSCYGQTKFQTPNLDKLAADGIRFTNYFVTDAGLTSHTALIYGKDSATEITIAQILKNSGYHTGLIGKWDLGDENSGSAPWEKGFDEFAGYLDPTDAENFYADYMFRYAPRSIYDVTNGQFETYVGREPIYPNTGGQKKEFIPDLLTKAALNFVKNNQPDPFNHYRPFILSLNYEIPTNRIIVPTDAPFSEESWPQAEKNKAALISRIDGYVGQLQEQLQKSGMTNNVVIFFSSASVPMKTDLIDPDFFHSNMSTNDLRVPMIAHWPGKIPAGQVSDYKWSAQDFLPTAAQIAYAQSPTNIDGTSVLPALLGRTEK